MGAMTAAALRRIGDGADIDSHDRRVIQDAARILRAKANAMKFLSSEGKGERPKVSSFAGARLAARAVSDFESDQIEQDSNEESSDRLVALARQLDKIQGSVDFEDNAKGIPKSIIGTIDNILPSFSAFANLTVYSVESLDDITLSP